MSPRHHLFAALATLLLSLNACSADNPSDFSPTAPVEVSAEEFSPAPASDPAFEDPNERQWMDCWSHTANIIIDGGGDYVTSVRTWNVEPPASASGLELESTENSFTIRVTDPNIVRLCGIKVTVGSSPQVARFVYLPDTENKSFTYTAPPGETVRFVGVLAERITT